MRNLLLFIGVGLVLAFAAYVFLRPHVNAPSFEQTNVPDFYAQGDTPEYTARTATEETAHATSEIQSLLPPLTQQTQDTPANTILSRLRAMNTPQVNGNTATYTNVALDDDAFSKIARLDITGTQNNIDRITIDGLQLTGDIGADGQLNIEGLNDRRTAIGAFLSGANNITIRNSTLSVLTKNIGGLSFDYDLVAQRGANGMDIQGTIESRQKNLKFVAAIEGTITSQGNWQINTAIEQGTAALKTVRIARGNAQISLRGDNKTNTPIQVAGTYGMGGLTLYKFPWQNVQGKLRGTLDTPISTFTATALGQDTIKTDMTVDTTGNDLTIGGKVYAERTANLIDYIERHNGLSTDKSGTLSALSDTANISLDFGVEGIQSAMRDRIVYRVDRPFNGKGYFLLAMPE